MSIRRAAVAGAALLLVGCYSLQPTGGRVPELGTTVGLEINDAGRAALGGMMGPEIGQIEGRLVERSNQDYLVAVSLLRLLRGGEQLWRGETVRIRNDYVTAIYERRFSKTRTAAAGAVAVGTIAAFLTKTIIGAGIADPGSLPGDTAHTQRRPRR